MKFLFRTIIYPLLSIVATLALALVVAEISIRIAGSPGPIISGWSWDKSPRRYLAEDEPLTGNQLGYRGQSISYEEDDYVIVLLGDSQVEAAGIDVDHMPERLLQKILERELEKPVKVFSIAASAWGQDQQLLALERYFKTYRANLVLLWPTPQNDYWENAFPDRSTGAAGHLKPTFRLAGDDIEGPFFESSFYYWHSAVVTVAARALARLRGEYIEQSILRDWMYKMPAGHPTSHAESKFCIGLESIRQEVAIEYRHLLKEDLEVVLVTNEDFINSRSHLSPYARERSVRDNYLIRLMQKLMEKIEKTAFDNESGFLVFYPEREDKLLIKCVKQQGSHAASIPVKLNHAELLRDVVSDDHLVVFELSGGNELKLSNTDYHLSILGNERAMHSLAKIIGEDITAK